MYITGREQVKSDVKLDSTIFAIIFQHMHLWEFKKKSVMETNDFSSDFIVANVSKINSTSFANNLPNIPTWELGK